MADLNAILNTISTAVYGKDVRQGIYDGIKFIHDEYLTIKDVADQVRSLINIYDQAVEDAERLSGELKELNKTGESLKNDLSGLSTSLSDGRNVLAQLKSENEKATSALTEAREKIPILQDLLSKIPDLQEAERIGTELATAYSNASDALEELNGLSGTVDQLTSLNNEAKTNLENYNQAKTDIEDLVNKTTDLESKVANYPEIVQQLEDAYQKVSEKTVDLEELNRILTEIDSDVQIINENKESVNLVAQNIEIIKQLGEMDLSEILNLESRIQALEQKEDLTPRVEKLETLLSGLEETLENLI